METRFVSKENKFLPPVGFDLPVMLSFVTLVIIILGALSAPGIAPYDPNYLDLSKSLQHPSFEHLLGTDKVGRDILSRLLFGARITLLSALAVVSISALIGVPLGLLCGYYGGKMDALIMRIWDVVLAFPALLLAFVFAASFGRGISSVILALGIVYIPMISRLTRSLTLTEKNKTYIEAGRSMGFSTARILFRHILPNCIPTLLAELALDIAYAMLDLAALSFLGLGVQPPTADWGAMLGEGREYLLINPLLALAPGIMIIITAVSFNLLSEGIQKHFDIKLRRVPFFVKVKLYAGEMNEQNTKYQKSAN